MGLIAFLKSRFGRKKEKKENDEMMTLSTDTSGFVPPETRFTEEYKDFLASQDAIASVKRENDNICEGECPESRSLSENVETAPGDIAVSENTESASGDVAVSENAEETADIQE